MKYNAESFGQVFKRLRQFRRQGEALAPIARLAAKEDE